MPIRFVRLLFVAAWVALLAACTSMPSNLRAPTCELVSVQMLSTDMFAQRFKVRLRIDNPNDIELPVTASSSRCSWRATASPRPWATRNSCCPRRATPSSTCW